MKRLKQRGAPNAMARHGTMKPPADAAPAAGEPLFKVRSHPLHHIFSPRGIAVVGASEEPGSVGRALMENIDGNAYRVFPINPGRASVLGRKARARVTDIPEGVDLAVIATRAATVPGIIEDCIEKGIRGAVIVSAGFRECGSEGAELERRIAATARGRMRLIGPNCLGIMAPHANLNATFAAAPALPGSIGFISQSGALCTALLDWSLTAKVGFSAFVSVGSMLDVGWGDLIYYLGDDPNTKSIICYMESVGDARTFLSAAREVALTKPIIVLKVGRTEQASKAAASHTGSMTGSDEVFDAALRRVGVLRVKTIEELFDMAEVLAKQPRPRGPRLAIVTNAGGPAALATDLLVASGGELAPLAAETVKGLDQLLPPYWSHGNPIDILGDADAGRYEQALRLVRGDPNTDGALAILTPQAMTDPTATAEALRPFADFDGKPFLACWMGGESVRPGRAILNAANISTYDYPDTAARAFEYLWRYSYNLRGIYETPSMAPASEEERTVREKAARLVAAARKAGRTLLTEFESKRILRFHGIPSPQTRVASRKKEALELAARIGYPVVLKLHSETITHKSDVGGVQLNLQNSTEVSRAWDRIESAVGERPGPEHFHGVTIQPMIRTRGLELIVGSSTDPQFGPVLLFGLGGELVEVFRDRALALPPLNSTLARRMMEGTRIYEALKGTRGRPPVDLAALEQLLVRFSRLVVEQPWIREIDINPLLAAPDQFLALDARVIVHGPETVERALPQLAIRPYPARYVTRWKLRNGTPVTLRPIRPEDEPLMAEFHQALSEETVYSRYFTALQLSQRVAHERLTRICFIDYDREIALVAERRNRKSGRHEILGVGRLSKVHGLNEAEFAILIADPWQEQGLGSELLKLLLRVARDEKLERVTARILPANRQMRSICRKLGFQVRTEDSEVRAERRV